MNGFLSTLLLIFMIVCVFSFFIAIGYLIFAINSEERKKALKILIFSIIGFIIGFGTCMANLTIGGMH